MLGLRVELLPQQPLVDGVMDGHALGRGVDGLGLRVAGLDVAQPLVHPHGREVVLLHRQLGPLEAALAQDLLGGLDQPRAQPQPLERGEDLQGPDVPGGVELFRLRSTHTCPEGTRLASATSMSASPFSCLAKVDSMMWRWGVKRPNHSRSAGRRGGTGG